MKRGTDRWSEAKPAAAIGLSRVLPADCATADRMWKGQKRTHYHHLMKFRYEKARICQVVRIKVRQDDGDDGRSMLPA